MSNPCGIQNIKQIFFPFHRLLMRGGIDDTEFPAVEGAARILYKINCISQKFFHKLFIVARLVRGQGVFHPVFRMPRKIIPEGGDIPGIGDGLVEFSHLVGKMCFLMGKYLGLKVVEIVTDERVVCQFQLF